MACTPSENWDEMNQTLFRVGKMGLSSTIQEFALHVSRQKNKWVHGCLLLGRFDRTSKGEVRASAKHMRLVTNMQREIKRPWERERGHFFSFLRPLRALLSLEKKRDVCERGRVHEACFFRPDWTHISLLLVACFWTRIKSVNRQEILKKKIQPSQPRACLIALLNTY